MTDCYCYDYYYYSHSLTNTSCPDHTVLSSSSSFSSLLSNSVNINHIKYFPATPSSFQVLSVEKWESVRETKHRPRPILSTDITAFVEARTHAYISIAASGFHSGGGFPKAAAHLSSVKFQEGRLS